MPSQFKLLTIISIDLAALKNAIAEREPGHSQNILATLSNGLAALVASHGGLVERADLELWQATFGAEVAREDDPVRAVSAGLALSKLLLDFRPGGAPLPLPPGVEVHTINMNPESLQIAKARGFLRDVFHDLEPLSSGASSADVVISQETYRHVYGLFNVQKLFSKNAEGGQESVRAYRVLSMRPKSLTRTLRGVEGGGINMVGREEEMERLRTAFRESVDKQELRMVSVLGEAGIGKSRLLHEFQDWLQENPCRTRLFCGRANSELIRVPFAHMREVFCARFDIQESDPKWFAEEKFAGEFVQLLKSSTQTLPGDDELNLQAYCAGQLLGFDFSSEPAVARLLKDPQQIRDRGFRGISALLACAGHRTKDTEDASEFGTRADASVLVLEDLHWGDDDTLDLITHLVQTLHKTPLLILCLARPTLLERRPNWFNHEGIRIDLPALSTRQSEMLVDAHLRNAPSVPRSLRDLVLADAGGNPFYIEELIKMFIEEKVIVPGSEKWTFEPNRLASVSVPSTLTGVLQARLDGLESLERAVLQRASVVGSIFWDTAVKDLGSHAGGRNREASGTASEPSTVEIQRVLSNLCSMDLIQRRELSGFSNTIEYTFKHELLRNAAYEGMARTERRQYHGLTAAWLIEHSGERIRELAGLVAVHYEQSGKLADAAYWYGQAGQQARAGHAPATAIDYFQKALDLYAGERRKGGAVQSSHLELYAGLSDTLAMQARFAEALDGFGKLRTLAESAGDLASQAHAWNGIAFLLERRGDNRASIEAAEKAELLARGAGEGCSAELARAAHLKGWAYYRLGDAAAVLSLADLTLKLAEQSNDLFSKAGSYKLFGVAHLQLGHYQDADGYFLKGLDMCEELGDRRNAGAMFSNLGESARLRGDYRAAVELYERALAVAKEIGDRPSEAIYLNNLCGARLGLRQFQEAEDGLRQVIALTDMPRSCSLAETYSFLARACLGQGKDAEALEAAQRAIAIAKESENHLDLGGGWRVLGQVAAMLKNRATFEAEGRAAPETNTRLPEAADPAACFEESLRIFDKMEADGERAATLLTWAEFDEAEGRLQQSREKSQKASEILKHMGT
jgi:predicted ATPase